MMDSIISLTTTIAPYFLCGYLFSRLDTDLTLWFYEKFGKRISTLKGKTVWIVGASSGIGEHLAYVLAAHGVKLALSGTREAKLQEVKQKCLQLNSRLSENAPSALG